MMEIARSELVLNDSDQLFFYLAIHLKTTIKRILSGKPIYNPRLEQIKQEHQREYFTALKMSNIVKRNYPDYHFRRKRSALSPCIYPHSYPIMPMMRTM